MLNLIAPVVREQGWHYMEPGHGRHPRLVRPDGRQYVFAGTGGDHRELRNIRTGLRRMGAEL